MKILKEILYDIAGTLAISVGLYSFAEKIDIAPGGVSGVSIMLRYLTGLPTGVLILVLNIPLLVLSYKFMGKNFTLKTMRTVLINTIMLDAVVSPYFPQYSGDRMLGSLFAGVLLGSGLAIVFMNGSSTAGTDIIGHIIEHQFPHISIGKALMIVDCIILGSSVLVFKNIESALYGLVALFTQTVLINKVVYGSEKGRNLFIVSQKNEEIARRIMNECNRGATFLTARGAYSNKPASVLMCVVRVWEYYRVKGIVYEEDPTAFVIATQADNIIGEGFSRK